MKLKSSTLTMPLAIVLLLVVTSGCGSSSTPALQENVDYTDAMDLFTTPRGALAGDPQALVATVNGKPISRALLEQNVQLQMINLKQRVAPESLEQIRPRLEQDVLNRLVMQALLLDAVDDEQIQVPPQQVEEQIEQLKQGLPEGTTWEATLTRANITEAKVREQLQTQMKMDLLLRTKVADIPAPTDAEMRAFYQENQTSFAQPERAEVRHLMIQVASDADEAARAGAKTQAEDLFRSIGEDATLEDLARRFSDDKTTRDRGGLMGQVARGQLPPALDQAVFDGELGVVSGPVRSPAGYHLITAESRTPARTLSYQESTDRIEKQLRSQALQEAIQQYVSELEKKADIQIAGRKPATPASP